MNNCYGPPVAALVIADTNAHEGRFNRVVFMENSEITSILAENWTGANLNGKTLPALLEIEGVITKVHLASGSCIAYRI